MTADGFLANLHPGWPLFSDLLAAFSDTAVLKIKASSFTTRVVNNK